LLVTIAIVIDVIVHLSPSIVLYIYNNNGKEWDIYIYHMCLVHSGDIEAS
jgi:hypothetical protein